MSFFKNKVVWITGASSGIGEALVYALAKENARLIISARRKEELERVKKNCLSATLFPNKINAENIFILPFDLANIENQIAITEQALSAFGRIEILINNGGITQRSSAAETIIDIDRRVMEVNYFSAVSLTKSVLPFMQKKNSGTIVNIGSIVGYCGVPKRSSYSASKHALYGFMEALREEVRKNNINIIMITPGFIKTNLTYNAVTANGSAYNKMDDGQAKGMSAERCADLILNAIRKNKKEIIIGGKEIFVVYIKRFFPWLYYQIIRRVKTT